jgi:putative chromate ion transporter
MRRDLVEARQWVSSQDYNEGLAFSQLCPGPLAAQLAMYLGWLRAGTVGATLAGVLFILPSFLMVLVLAALYIRLGSLSWIQDVFYGVGAAVIAIIARSGLARSGIRSAVYPVRAGGRDHKAPPAFLSSGRACALIGMGKFSTDLYG